MKASAIVLLMLILSGCRKDDSTSLEQTEQPVEFRVECSGDWKYMLNDDGDEWDMQNDHDFEFDVDSIYINVWPRMDCPQTGGLKIIAIDDTVEFPSVGLGGCGSAYARNLYRSGVGMSVGRHGRIMPPAPTEYRFAQIRAANNVHWAVFSAESESLTVTGAGNHDIANQILGVGHVCVTLTITESEPNDSASITILPENMSGIANQATGWNVEVCVD